jgi:hypothetical protein
MDLDREKGPDPRLELRIAAQLRRQGLLGIEKVKGGARGARGRPRSRRLLAVAAAIAIFASGYAAGSNARPPVDGASPANGLQGVPARGVGATAASEAVSDVVLTSDPDSPVRMAIWY